MCNQMRPHAAVGQIHQVKPPGTRGKREVSDAYKVSATDAALMSLQGIERPPKQSGTNLPVDFVGLRERGSRG